MPEGRHAVAVVKLRPGETVLLGGGGRRAQATVTHTGQGRLLGAARRSPRRAGARSALRPRAGAGQGRPRRAGGGDRDRARRRRGRPVAGSPRRRRVARPRARGEGPSPVGVGMRRRRQAVPARRGYRSSPSRRAPPRSRSASPRRRSVWSCTRRRRSRSPASPFPTTGTWSSSWDPRAASPISELAALTAAGARPVRLGPEVLRSSTAGPAALAVLASAGRWR